MASAFGDIFLVCAGCGADPEKDTDISDYRSQYDADGARLERGGDFDEEQEFGGLDEKWDEEEAAAAAARGRARRNSASSGDGLSALEATPTSPLLPGEERCPPHDLCGDDELLLEVSSNGSGSSRAAARRASSSSSTKSSRLEYSAVDDDEEQEEEASTLTPKTVSSSNGSGGRRAARQTTTSSTTKSPRSAFDDEEEEAVSSSSSSSNSGSGGGRAARQTPSSPSSTTTTTTTTPKTSRLCSAVEDEEGEAVSSSNGSGSGRRAARQTTTSSPTTKPPRHSALVADEEGEALSSSNGSGSGRRAARQTASSPTTTSTTETSRLDYSAVDDEDEEEEASTKLFSAVDDEEEEALRLLFFEKQQKEPVKGSTRVVPSSSAGEEEDDWLEPASWDETKKLPERRATLDEIAKITARMARVAQSMDDDDLRQQSSPSLTSPPCSSRQQSSPSLRSPPYSSSPSLNRSSPPYLGSGGQSLCRSSPTYLSSGERVSRSMTWSPRALTETELVLRRLFERYQVDASGNERSGISRTRWTTLCREAGLEARSSARTVELAFFEARRGAVLRSAEHAARKARREPSAPAHVERVSQLTLDVPQFARALEILLAKIFPAVKKGNGLRRQYPAIFAFLESPASERLCLLAVTGVIDDEEDECSLLTTKPPRLVASLRATLAARLAAECEIIAVHLSVLQPRLPALARLFKRYATNKLLGLKPLWRLFEDWWLSPELVSRQKAKQLIAALMSREATNFLNFALFVELLSHLALRSTSGTPRFRLYSLFVWLDGVRANDHRDNHARNFSSNRRIINFEHPTPPKTIKPEREMKPERKMTPAAFEEDDHHPELLWPEGRGARDNSPQDYRHVPEMTMPGAYY